MRWGDFLLAFVPLFVAVDALGLLPLFLGMTEGLERPRVRRVVLQSTFTALTVGLVFLAGGPAMLAYLGITPADFMVAGGALLFALSLWDLLSVEKPRPQVDPESLGVVPLGVPLMVGPAVLTTTLLLAGQFGRWVTGLALVANILLAGGLFWIAEPVHRALGRAGTRALSKLAGLLLASIGVMMVRRGVMTLLGG